MCANAQTAVGFGHMLRFCRKLSIGEATMKRTAFRDTKLPKPLIVWREAKILKNLISMLLTLLTLGLAAGTASALQAPVNLGTAGNFAILSKSGIATTGTTSIVGNIGTSPIAAIGITGFGLIMDASNQF